MEALPTTQTTTHRVAFKVAVISEDCIDKRKFIRTQCYAGARRITKLSDGMYELIYIIGEYKWEVCVMVHLVSTLVCDYDSVICLVDDTNIAGATVFELVPVGTKHLIVIGLNTQLHPWVDVRQHVQDLIISRHCMYFDVDLETRYNIEKPFLEVLKQCVDSSVYLA